MTKKTNDATEVNYTVNNLNQVTAIGSETFRYDGNGNRTYRGTSGGWVWNYSYDDENQLGMVEAPGYWKK